MCLGGGQADEQGCSPSGLAQENLQGQEEALPTVESAVPGWAVNYFPDDPVVGPAVESTVESVVESVVEDPHFRLPTQPKVVEGWGGTGEASDPHVLVEGEGGGTGAATHGTEDVGVCVGGSSKGGRSGSRCRRGNKGKRCRKRREKR